MISEAESAGSHKADCFYQLGPGSVSGQAGRTEEAVVSADKAQEPTGSQQTA